MEEGEKNLGKEHARQSVWQKKRIREKKLCGFKGQKESK